MAPVVLGQSQTGLSPSYTSTAITGYTPVAGDLILNLAHLEDQTWGFNTIPADWFNPMGGTTGVVSEGHLVNMLAHWVTEAEAAANTRQWSFTNLYTSGATGRVMTVAIRGVDQTTPFDQVVGNTLVGSSTSMAWASMTPTRSDCLIIGFGSPDNRGQAIGSPASPWVVLERRHNTVNASSYILIGNSNASVAGELVPGPSVSVSNDQWSTIVMAINRPSTAFTADAALSVVADPGLTEVSRGQAMGASLAVDAVPDQGTRNDALANANLFLDAIHYMVLHRNAQALSTLSLTAEMTADATEFGSGDALLGVMADPFSDMTQGRSLTELPNPIEATFEAQASRGQEFSVLETVVTAEANSEAIIELANSANLVANAIFTSLMQRVARGQATLAVSATTFTEAFSGPVLNTALSVAVTLTASAATNHSAVTGLGIDVNTNTVLSVTYSIEAVLDAVVNVVAGWSGLRTVVVVPRHDRAAVVAESDRTAVVVAESRSVAVPPHDRSVIVTPVDREVGLLPQ